MEQGPILEAEGFPLGVVTGIAGQTRQIVMISGTQVSLLLSSKLSLNTTCTSPAPDWQFIWAPRGWQFRQQHPAVIPSIFLIKEPSPQSTVVTMWCCWI
jgi:hypothetical protein